MIKNGKEVRNTIACRYIAVQCKAISITSRLWEICSIHQKSCSKYPNYLAYGRDGRAYIVEHCPKNDCMTLRVRCVDWMGIYDRIELNTKTELHKKVTFNIFVANYHKDMSGIEKSGSLVNVRRAWASNYNSRNHMSIHIWTNAHTLTHIYMCI